MSPQEELALRKRQLQASEGKYGYRDRCEALRARIIELEALINGS
jgi:hypothetical protein